MDPFVNIARQRQLAAQIVTDTDALAGYRDTIKAGGTEQDLAHVAAQAMGRELAIEHAAEELAELVTALDEWQAKGGFSPYPLNLPTSVYLVEYPISESDPAAKEIDVYTSSEAVQADWDGQTPGELGNRDGFMVTVAELHHG